MTAFLSVRKYISDGTYGLYKNDWFIPWVTFRLLLYKKILHCDIQGFHSAIDFPGICCALNTEKTSSSKTSVLIHTVSHPNIPCDHQVGLLSSKWGKCSHARREKRKKLFNLLLSLPATKMICLSHNPVLSKLSFLKSANALYDYVFWYPPEMSVAI
jgi:hypothetical protein